MERIGEKVVIQMSERSHTILPAINQYEQDFPGEDLRFIISFH
jgi:hypothetical protein